MKKVFSLLISNFILAIVFANKVLAQDNFGVNELSDGGIALGTKSMQDTIAGIINIFLGFLGTLATILLLYAGYLWMTSAGNAQKVAKAKLMITSALIGLVIILSAYAISRFILQELYDATVPAGPTACFIDDDCSSDCCVSGFCESNSACTVSSLTCSNPGAGLEEEPRICSLNRILGPVGSGITIRGWNFDVDPAPNTLGEVTIGGVVAEIVECAGSSMWEDRKVKIKVPDSLTPGNYPLILINDVGNNNELYFEAFDFTVTPGVSEINIDCLVPNPVDVVDLPITSPDVLSVLGDGFGTTELDVVMYGGIDGDIELDLDVISWSDLQIDVEIPITAISSNLSVVIGPNPEDRAYEFLDISCEDASAGSCVSGCCDSNSCLPADVCAGSIVVPIEGVPVIDYISPEDGEEGTLITISGYNFGDDTGEVTFREVAGDYLGISPFTINAACIDTWTDNYIIISVPAGASTDELLSITVTQAVASGGESSEELVNAFERNNTVRPGICYLSPDEGVFGENITIEGVNFTATDTAYFDTMLSHITDVTVPNSASTQIPNIYGNLPVTMVSIAGDTSNQFPFLAIAASGGDPIITELSPNNGPVDSYLTIMGSGFGDETGVVYFDLDNNPTNLNEEIGGIDFPAQCGDYWFDDHIIIKVPSGAWVMGNDYPIRVERSSDSVMSNDFDFTITDVAPGPQICAIIPDNGPINLPDVRIFGENLGSDDSANLVTFYEDVNTTYGAWNANQVLGIEVPVGASAGPVTVTDSDGNISNALPFDVGACTADSQCGATEECCAEGYCAISCEAELNSCAYSWEVETDNEPFGLHYNYNCEADLQSPSPWPDLHTYEIDTVTYVGHSLDAFIDTNILALFTRDVEDIDFNNTNITLNQCTNDTCSAYVGTPLPGIIEIINHNTNREGFSFNPDTDGDPETADGDLLADTWYEVVLGTFNAEVGSDTWTNPDTWYFKTREDDILCVVDNVVVTPQYPQSNMYPGQEKNFNASPAAANCNICGGAYEWDWEVSHNPGPVGDYAVIPAGAEHSEDENIGHSILEGGLGATQFIVDNFVTLTAENIDYSISGYSESMILAPVLRVENYAPSCNDSCGNAVIFAEFNTELQASGVSQFGVHHCDTASCDTYGSSITDSIDIGDPYRVQINESSDLSEALINGESYIVIVAADIVNIYGYELGADFSWIFTVGDENCEMTSADISPDNYETFSLDDISYKGYAMADGGSCGAEAIICDTCDWNWSSSNNSIATIESGGIGENIVLATPIMNTIIPPIDISLTIDGTTLGYTIMPSHSTPLTISVSSIVTPTTDLNLLEYWPNCAAGSNVCTNSEVGARFNTPIDVASLATNVSVINTTSGVDIVNNFTLTDLDRSVTINTTVPLETGVTYNVTFGPNIENTSAEILDTTVSYSFAVGLEDCLIDVVHVQPVTATVGASQDVAYSIETEITTIAGCEPIPLDCSTCDYTWSDTIDLGDFDNENSPNPTFTTNSFVTTGQTTNIEVDVLDQGVTFEDFGLLTIDIAPGDIVDLISHEPIVSPACNNIASYFIFDISIGLLDKSSVRDNMKLYEACTTPGPWCLVDGNISFAEGVPGTELAIFNQTNLLTNNTVHLLMLENSDLVVSSDGNPITISDALVVSHPDFGLNDRGFTFITSDESCSIHSVEIDYNEGEELFTCIENDCEGDWAGGAVGNQHQYRSIVRDIRNAVLAASTITMTYDWMSLDTDIFYPETAIDYEIFATANNNGVANLNLEVFLVSEPSNIVTTNEPLEVNTCEVPWPSLSTYPWNDGEELNFSTYYCQNYDASSPATLPNISVPHTTASPDSNVIEEFITTINYGITDSGQQNPYLGSLAYNNEESKELEVSWAAKLSSLFATEKVNGQAFGCTPRRPSNLSYTYDSLAGEVELTWRQLAAIASFTDPQYFEIQRDLEGDASGYVTLANYNPASPIVGNHSYIDNTIDENSVYNYRIIARNNDCSSWSTPMPTGWEPLEDNPVVIVNTYSSSESIVDIIGFRVMKNEEHLSVLEWYSKMFPTAEDSGDLIKVDGYEALQVGATVYVAASNAYDPTSTLYTNIYIIAHNIGANTETLNIYAQMLDNFKLNTNIPGDLNSVCSGQGNLSCSSDFDCPAWCNDGSGNNESDCSATWASDSCDARLLKLRRDTKRLSDLVNIDNAILAYGQANKACETNSLISCEEDTDCPGGTCVPYYPSLNAGSYLDGLSNTSWPSWQGALANTLAMSLPLDPINLFNGCGDTPEGHNVNTCWNETSLEFSCSDNSLVYMYNINGIGQSYYLGAQFEYDSIISMPPAITFAGNLDHPVTMDLGQINCLGGSIAAPGSTLNPYCGNGIPGESYCSVRCAGCDTNTTLCNLGGGTIITEECDSEFWNFACSEYPNGAPTTLGSGGLNGWWNEQTIGCNAPGTVNADTNTLIECTWYVPDPEFTAAQCGGYCGDGAVQSYYESCDDDATVPSGYICVDGPASSCSDGCQVMCDDSAGEYPAALCGDGIWSETIEECDASASPSGTANWDCTEGGNISCSTSCIRTCTVGDPYPGLCGDGNLDSLEECDYAAYEQPSPPDSGPSPSPSYGCTELCEMNDEYCGDGVLQYEDGHEICDYDTFYSVPDPLASDEYRQYACRDSGIYTATNNSEHGACSATLGGYCGDGNIQDSNGEDCDPGSPWDGIDPNPLPPSTILSSPENQYFCDIDCVGTTGGYCGDGIAQSVVSSPIAYENCDGVDYPGRPLPAASNEFNTYDCATNCIDTISGLDGGRYCGDGHPDPEFHESCDWTPADYPWPRGGEITNFSGVGNEYACYECVNQGGYCGDGDLDGECNVNCAGWNGSNFTSPHCDLDECVTAGGSFVEQYEQCDSGWNPDTLIDKKVDMVYVFDMSGSMGDRATALCDATQGVVDQLVADGVEHRISIFVLGDNDGGVSVSSGDNGAGSHTNPVTQLTASTADDIEVLSGWLGTNGWLDEAHWTFRNLYTSCDLRNAPYDTSVRYLSFYENDNLEPAYNHIVGGVSTDGNNALYGQTCNDTADGAGRVENWGYALARIIEDYIWEPGFTRIIVPVSDEGAYCGSNTSSILENENCTATGYNGGIDVLWESISLANAADPVVHINPVLFTGFDNLRPHGECLADGTGGYFTDSTTNWATTTLDVINATFCDGDGDGYMDCTLAP